MTKEEYIKLFHEAEVNLVAFKPVFHCDDELRKMVEMAIEKEREECVKICDERVTAYQYATDPWAREHIDEAKHLAETIRARGQQ